MQFDLGLKNKKHSLTKECIGPQFTFNLAKNALSNSKVLLNSKVLSSVNFFAFQICSYKWPGANADLDLFKEPGIYKVSFFASDKSSIPRALGTTLVVRESGNSLEDFNLVSPKNGATVNFNEGADGKVVFNWDPILPRSNDVRYQFSLWKENRRDPKNLDPVFQSRFLKKNSVSFGPEDLPGGLDTPLYWDVIAMDFQGNTQESTDLFAVKIMPVNTVVVLPEVYWKPGNINNHTGGKMFIIGPNYNPPGVLFDDAVGHYFKDLPTNINGLYEFWLELPGYQGEPKGNYSEGNPYIVPSKICANY